MVLEIDSQTDSHTGAQLWDEKHTCGIVNGITEARWTSVDVGEQVYTRLLIRVSRVRPPHGPLFLGIKYGPRLVLRAFLRFQFISHFQN